MFTIFCCKTEHVLSIRKIRDGLTTTHRLALENHGNTLFVYISFLPNTVKHISQRKLLMLSTSLEYCLVFIRMHIYDSAFAPQITRSENCMLFFFPLHCFYESPSWPCTSCPVCFPMELYPSLCFWKGPLPSTAHYRVYFWSHISFFFLTYI